MLEIVLSLNISRRERLMWEEGEVVPRGKRQEVMTCDGRWASQNLNDCETDQRLSRIIRNILANASLQPSSYR